MDFAKTIQDEIVSATNAVRGRRYYCPVCSAPVSLKRQFVNRAHFAHAKGSGSPDCELYHPGSAIQPHHTPGYAPHVRQERLEPEYRAPILCISVAGESIDSFSWSLRIWLPRSRTTQGRFRIERQPGQFKDVALAQLALEEVLVSVPPGLSQYRASFFSGDVDPEYKKIAATPVDGLTDNRITVFAKTGNPAKLMADRLSWGGTYLFVWSNSLEIFWPEGLHVGVVSNNQKWSCSAVTLPSDATPKIDDWAFENTGLRIAPAHTGCFVLPPSGVRIGSAGEVPVLSRVSPLVLFASTATGFDTGTHSISFSGGGQSASIEASLSPTCLLKLDTPAGRSALQVDDKNVVEFSSFDRDTSTIRYEFVELAVEDLQGNTITCPFHSPLARESLQNVRRGQSKIIRLSVPIGVIGCVSWRHRNDLGWQQQEIQSPTIKEASESPLNPIDENIVGLISHSLTDSTADITISFEGFGYVGLAADSNIRQRLRLSNSTRIRLIWVLHQSGQLVGHGTDAAMDDRSLVRLFRKIQPPAYLASHWLALNSELTNHPTNH